MAEENPHALRKAILAELDDPLWRRMLDTKPEHLEVEWLNQPVYYLKVSRLYAAALGALATCEVEERRVEAALSLRYRTGGLPEGVKATEDSIKSAIRVDPEYLAASAARVAQLEVTTTLAGLQEAMRMRERSIKAMSYNPNVAPEDHDRTAAAAGGHFRTGRTPSR